MKELKRNIDIGIFDSYTLTTGSNAALFDNSTGCIISGCDLRPMIMSRWLHDFGYHLIVFGTAVDIWGNSCILRAQNVFQLRPQPSVCSEQRKKGVGEVRRRFCLCPIESAVCCKCTTADFER